MVRMIFNVPGHIDMIRNGTKTQTRRVNRGVYQVGRDYAVQQKRGVKAENDIRIVMDKIWEEARYGYGLGVPTLSEGHAQAEGGYTPQKYEQEFRKAYPRWDEDQRWAFRFHVIEDENEG
jgi:hypothetical protein